MKYTSLEKLLNGKLELNFDVDADPKEFTKAAERLRSEGIEGLVESAKTCNVNPGGCDAEAITEALDSAEEMFNKADELESAASKLEEAKAIEESICGAEIRPEEGEFDYKIVLKDDECPTESLESIYEELEDRPHTLRNLTKRLVPANADQEYIIDMMKDTTED